MEKERESEKEQKKMRRNFLVVVEQVDHFGNRTYSSKSQNSKWIFIFPELFFYADFYGHQLL